MARKQHWLTEIANEVRQRAFDAVDTVASGIKDSTPFGNPPAPPPQLSLQEYMAAPGPLRQAMLQTLPVDEFTDTISRLQNEAVTKYGAMASVLSPMFAMDEAAVQAPQAISQDPSIGMQAAHAELVDLLGMDPFA